jgi:hypothetical protein
LNMFSGAVKNTLFSFLSVTLYIPVINDVIYVF